MVRERMQYLYGVGDDRCIEIHDSTTDLTPRGTVTEVHHVSDSHISTALQKTNGTQSRAAPSWQIAAQIGAALILREQYLRTLTSLATLCDDWQAVERPVQIPPLQVSKDPW
jgi:hypothetical protein